MVFIHRLHHIIPWWELQIVDKHPTAAKDGNSGDMLCGIGGGQKLLEVLCELFTAQEWVGVVLHHFFIELWGLHKVAHETAVILWGIGA